jgi:hypothetical protein
MLKIIILELNEEYGLNQVLGEKDVSDLSVEDAHKQAQKFVDSLQEFKTNRVTYHLEKDGNVLAYLKD